ncbi:MAG: DUF4376 domain-containing protein [Kingella denitrificans]
MSTETKTVYQLDRHHCYLCTTVADRDPLDKNNWLIPAGCVETAPPQTGENQAAQWQQESQTWRIIPDYRGQNAYRTDTWQHDGIAADTVTEPGELPAGLTIEPPPSNLHTWDGKAWVLDAETAAALKQAQQEEMWTRIKAKREMQRYGGAYIPVLKKWLQTDEPSRTQYLQLQLLEAKGLFKQPVRWKTMDNSFIGLDAAAVTAIALQIMDNEQVDFANAERHRAAMLKASNPLDYDYSDGWTEIYQAA